MHRIFVVCAFLSATPLVAQWTVRSYVGGAVPLTTPITSEAVTVPLALDPAGSVVIADAADKVIWRIRAGGMEPERPLTEDELQQLRQNLARLSEHRVRDLYDEAWEECRIKGQRIPPPKAVQQLVQAWRELWRWRR